jgi:hypothetical protein
MMEPTPVYIELDAGFDHDAIERELDEQMGLTPKPPKWRPVGPVLVCGHVRISRSTSAGLTDVVCLDCSHEYLEVES